MTFQMTKKSASGSTLCREVVRTLLFLPPSGINYLGLNRDRMLKQQPKSRKRERKAKGGETEKRWGRRDARRTRTGARGLQRTWIVIKFHHVHHPINQRKKLKLEEDEVRREEGPSLDWSGGRGGGHEKGRRGRAGSQEQEGVSQRKSFPSLRSVVWSMRIKGIKANSVEREISRNFFSQSAFLPSFLPSLSPVTHVSSHLRPHFPSPFHPPIFHAAATDWRGTNGTE